MTVPRLAAPRPAAMPGSARWARRAVRAWLVAGGRSLALAATGLAAVLGGLGWLFLLRGAGILSAGPGLAEALPLQRLAGGAAQPLGRLVVAWLPAGLAAGVLLARAGFARRVTRALLMLVVGAALLMLLGGFSDAITESDPLGSHLGAQPGRAAIWVAAAPLAAGAAIPRGRRRA
jgi:hypothetical protein